MANIFKKITSHDEDDKEQLVDINEPEKNPDKLKRSLKDFLLNFKIHKSPSKKEPKKFNSKVLFIILGLVCVTLIILTSVNAKFATPFKAAASAVITPAQSGINIVGAWVAEKIDDIHTINELTEENKTLKKQLEELTSENNRLRNKANEIDQLNELLELKDVYEAYETTAARVISKDTSNWFASFTVNKGFLDGISQNMNVITSGGLVGVISDVGPNYATVRSIINDDSSISASIKDTQDLCVVSGNLSLMTSNLLEFSDVDVSVHLTEGDAVVTSNISSIYLPGLLIGYVNDYQVDGSELTQSGHITPAVNFDNFTEVLIITELKETGDK